VDLIDLKVIWRVDIEIHADEDYSIVCCELALALEIYFEVF